MNTDPYTTPAANPHVTPLPASTGTVSAAAVEQLAATKPWVRFMSVITFIGAGFMLVAAAGMVMISMLGGLAGSRMPASQVNNPLSGAMGLGIAALYAVLSIVYIFPGVKLWKYAGSIAMLIQSGRDEDLVAALNQQRSFWKFVGILVLIMLVIYFIAIIGVAVFAGITAAKAH
jgi:hypothetical protein